MTQAQTAETVLKSRLDRRETELNRARTDLAEFVQEFPEPPTGSERPFDEQVGWVWTLLKGFVIAILVIWFRVAWPRMREDQLQRMAWLFLLPLALFQLGLTGIGVVMTR